MLSDHYQENTRGLPRPLVQYHSYQVQSGRQVYIYHQTPTDEVIDSHVAAQKYGGWMFCEQTMKKPSPPKQQSFSEVEPKAPRQDYIAHPNNRLGEIADQSAGYQNRRPPPQQPVSHVFLRIRQESFNQDRKPPPQQPISYAVPQIRQESANQEKNPPPQQPYPYVVPQTKQEAVNKDRKSPPQQQASHALPQIKYVYVKKPPPLEQQISVNQDSKPPLKQPISVKQDRKPLPQQPISVNQDRNPPQQPTSYVVPQLKQEYVNQDIKPPSQQPISVSQDKKPPPQQPTSYDTAQTKQEYVNQDIISPPQQPISHVVPKASQHSVAHLNKGHGQSADEAVNKKAESFIYRVRNSFHRSD